MSRLDKEKDHIRSLPSDLTYVELREFLAKLGFKEFTKGKTSGSRVRFYRESDNRIIQMHRPHGGDAVDKAAVKDLVKYLKDINEL